MRWIVCGLAALALGVSSAASAGEFSRSGPYVGIGGIWGTEFLEDDIEDVMEDVIDPSIDLGIESSWGLDLVGGYRLLPFLATELQYEYVDLIQLDVTNPANAELDVNGHVVTANVKLLIPTWRIQPYLLLGVGTALCQADGEILGNDVFERDDWVFAARVGLGLDLYLTRHLLVNVGATTVFTTFSDFEARDVSQLNYVAGQVGLQYRF
jgi:opacity protein-like surface antigen